MHVKMTHIFENDHLVKYFFKTEVPTGSIIDTNDKKRKQYEVKNGVIILEKHSEKFYFDESNTDPIFYGDKRLKIKLGSRLVRIKRAAEIFPPILDILYC
jgi:hypothetical protein